MATNVSVALAEVTRPTKGLTVVLWILQILAAAMFFLAGGLKLAGVAPIEASSAGDVRHRLSRRGNRRLNMLLYLIALAQQRSYAPAQAYMARRQQEGRTPREARRALKRHLVRRIWHQWQACWPGASATT